MPRVAVAFAVIAAGCAPPRATPVAPRLPDEPAADAGDAAVVDAGVGGVVPLTYQLELAIDPEATGYTGTVTIDVHADTPTREIWLDSDGPRVDRATLTVDDAVQVLAPIPGAAAGRLGLALATPLAPGDARLEVRFAADYRSEDGVFAQAFRARRYVFSDFEPIDARRAFPCFDQPTWKTPWTVSLVVPARATALSNTSPARTTELDGGLRRVEFEPTGPLPTYLVAIAVGPFDVVEATGGPVPTRVIVPHGRGAAAARAAALAPEIAELTRAFVDRPVPFGKLDVVAVPRFGGAMENPGLVTVASDILLDGRGASGERRLALVLAHELAHLWFGDSVTPVDWRDLWINEGVASWIADEVLARLRPAWQTRRDELRSRDEAMDEDELPGAHPLRPDALDGPRALFDVLTYQKGAALLHMVDAWVGGGAVIGALRGYLDAHAGGGATTADLVAALAPIGDGVADVLEPLISTAGVPEVDAVLDCAGPARLRLSVRPTPDGAAAGPLPVCARWGDGRGARRACALVAGEAELALGATCPPWVTADADGAGYYRWTLAGASLADTIAGAGGTDRDRLDAARSVARALAAGADLAEIAAALRAAVRTEIPEVVEAAVATYRTLLRQVAPAAARHAVAAHLRAALAPTLRRLGTRPSAGESADDRRTRAVALTAAGTLADDPKVVAWARRTARRWLRDHRRVPRGDLLAPALRIAAAHADDRLAAALLRAAASPLAPDGDDPDDGGVLAGALGELPRARALHALDAALGGALPADATFTLAAALLARDDTAPAAADALAGHGDWLAIALSFAPTCDPTLVERLAPSAAALASTGDRSLERALARRRLDAARCDALRPVVAGAARAFR